MWRNGRLLISLGCLWGLMVPALARQSLPGWELMGAAPDTAVLGQLMVRAQGLAGPAPDSAFIYAQQVLRAAGKRPDPRFQAQAEQLTGQLYARQGAYTQALAALLRAQGHWQALGDSLALAAIHHDLGWIHYYTGQPEEARSHHEAALALYSALGHRPGMARALGDIGHYYEKSQRYDQARDYQHQALRHYEALGDSAGMASIYENLGSIHEDLGAFTTAYQYFARALALKEAAGQGLDAIGTYNNLGDIYRKTGDYVQALTYSQRALQLARDLGDRHQESSALRDLGKTYAALQRYPEAYRHLEQGRELDEGIFTQENARQLALLQTLFETERMLDQIERLEQERRHHRNLRLLILGGALLLLVLGGVIISRQRLRIRKNREILEQQHQVHETRQQLLQAELENRRLHEQQLELQLHSRSKALTTHTLHLRRKNDFLQSLRQELAQLVPSAAKAQRAPLQHLIQQIDHSLHTDTDWEDFRRVFEQVHQRFFDHLQTQHPGLTEAETRLCALIKLGLPSPEMAATLGISPDSLRIARYRLRKKLGLAKGDDLRGYITGL